MTRVLLAGVLAISLTGCADLNDTQERALTGAAAGAAGGALIGAISGSAGMGAAIGAGAGLVGGLLVDTSKKNEEAAYQRGVEDGQSAN